jgi:predicted transcriptional regulator
MKLIQLLEKKNLSKLQLALRAGISPSDLYDAINGRKPFYPAWKKRISECLEMTEEDIFMPVESVDKNR